MGLIGDCECINTYDSPTENYHQRYSKQRVTVNVIGDGDDYTSGGVKEKYTFGSHHVNGYSLFKSGGGFGGGQSQSFSNVLTTQQVASGELTYVEKCYYQGTIELPLSSGTVNLWGRISSGTSIGGYAWIDDPEIGVVNWSLNTTSGKMSFENSPRYDYENCTWGVGDWITEFPEPFWRLPSSYDAGGVTCTPSFSVYSLNPETCLPVGFSFYRWLDDPDNPSEFVQFQLRHDGYMTVTSSVHCFTCSICHYSADLNQSLHDYLGTSTLYKNSATQHTFDPDPPPVCLAHMADTLEVTFEGW